MKGSASAPELGDDEGHPLRHQPGDEGHVTREAIELGDDDGTLAATRDGKGFGQLWAPVERVGALAALCLDKLGCEFEAFSLRKALDGISLGIDAEARAPLSFGGDAVIGDSRLHDQTAYHRLPIGGKPN